MTSLAATSPESVSDLLGLDVINKVGDPLGSVDALWRNHLTGRLQFIGVKTGWFSKALQAIPVVGLSLDAAKGRVVLPYTTGQVKGAPAFDADATITDAGEAAIFRYYGIRERSGVAPAGVDSGATTGRGGPKVSDPTNADAADYTASTGKGGYQDTTAPAK